LSESAHLSQGANRRLVHRSKYINDGTGDRSRTGGMLLSAKA
jgi:hypothetical protein